MTTPPTPQETLVNKIAYEYARKGMQMISVESEPLDEDSLCSLLEDALTTALSRSHTALVVKVRAKKFDWSMPVDDLNYSRSQIEAEKNDLIDDILKLIQDGYE